MRFLLFALASLLIAAPAVPQTASRMLEPDVRPLRHGDGPEWLEFAALDADSVLVVAFEAAANDEPATLELTQYDVRREWRIQLNGADLGSLEADEQRMTVYRDVPAGTLVDGQNVLRIASFGDGVDDVLVGRIRLHERPRGELLGESGLAVEVVDGASGEALPARITIVNEQRALQTVSDVVGPGHSAVRVGTVYAGRGAAELRLPGGRYTVYASRGFEYGADSLEVALQPGGAIRHRLSIRREVPTDGWISMDPHVHTLTYSGHGDATAEERVLTLAGEGLELPVLTEHNQNVDLRPIVESMGYGDVVAPITGNEYTTAVGHFNLFPVTPEGRAPDAGVDAWSALRNELAGVGSPKVVVLNHPRDLHAGFRPFGPENFIASAGRIRGGGRLPANAMEVVNSSAQQHDVMDLVRDWFAAVNAGHDLTPVGSSDSHDVARYVVGQGRTYVRVDVDDPARVDVAEVLERFRMGSVVASFGLMPTLMVEGRYGPGDIVPSTRRIEVDVRVLAPSWIEADRIVLYANGIPVREAEISPGGRAGEKWSDTWTVDVPSHDVFFSVVALGPGRTPPFWPVAKPYRRLSPVWNPRVVGVTGPVWVDVDGDGHPTPARTYAERLVEHAADIQELTILLASYDEAVAIQAAAELYERGEISKDFRVDGLPADTPASVRRGFERFVRSLGQ